jgi:hypothetical protein
VVRSVWIFLLVVGWSATTALAAPAARQRVVLADPDPELRHAMEQALAPWHLEIVIEGPSPTDTAMAQERADADTARFVVWRKGDELVVYDRELGFTEQRSCQAGVLDPPAAAAAALTIKTMMRLPPPPPPSEAVPPASPEGPVGSSFEVRLQAAIATRITHGNDTRITARFGGAAEIRPWAGSGWRFGVAGDSGTATAVSQASFKGTWSEWTAFGLVSWTYLRGAWEFEPHAGAGIRRSRLDGSETTGVHNERATLPSARGGLWVRGRVSRWTFGAALDVDGSFGTPTYSKTGAPAEIFQVPGVGAELGAVVAVDL